MNQTKVNRIKTIFAETQKVIPEQLSGAHEWLRYLEEDALNDDSSIWVNILKGFLRGLWGAQAIELEDLDDINKLLIKNGFT